MTNPEETDKSYLNLFGASFIIHGDYDSAMSHLDTARAMLFQLNLVNVDNINHTAIKKSLEDGTYIECSQNDGNKFVTIIVPGEGLEIEQEKRVEVDWKIPSERIVPIIMARDGSGFIACLSGTFKGPYMWFPNDSEWERDAFFTVDYHYEGWANPDPEPVPHMQMIAEADSGEKLFFLESDGKIPPDLEDWPDSVDEGLWPGEGSYIDVIDDPYLEECIPLECVDYQVSNPDGVVCLYAYKSQISKPAVYVFGGPAERYINFEAYGKETNILSYRAKEARSGTYKYICNSGGITLPDWPQWHYNCETGDPIIQTWTSDGIRWAAANGQMQANRNAWCNYNPDVLCSQREKYYEYYGEYEWDEPIVWQHSFRFYQEDMDLFCCAYITHLSISYNWQHYDYLQCGIPKTDESGSTYSSTKKLYLNINNTKHIIEEWDSTIQATYSQKYWAMKYYSSETQTGNVVLLGIIKNNSTHNIKKFNYYYWGNRTNHIPEEVSFDLHFSDGFMRYYHEILDVTNKGDMEGIFFEGLIFLGVIQSSVEQPEEEIITSKVPEEETIIVK